MKSFLCCALVLLVGAASVQAGDCCEGCGCAASCSKVCRLVPSTKKVTKTEYECECEDFCVPGRSLRTVCHDECGKKKIVYTPTCAEVRTRKKLVKKETSTTVPSTKWVVENLCPRCAGQKTSDPAVRDGMAEANVAPSDLKALAADVGASQGNSSGGGFASRVRSDLARVLWPAGSQK